MTDDHPLCPLLEFDPAPTAVIEPTEQVRAIDVPEHALLCFLWDALDAFVARHGGRVLKQIRIGMGTVPLYEVSWAGRRLAVLRQAIGAPLAAGLLEEVIALGCRKFVACGGAGVLDKALVCGHLIVLTSALRDEGTSHHYAPPGRYAHPAPPAVAAIEAACRDRGLAYTLGRTWTTDAFYRETRQKVQRRKAEGCLTVEMEASALFAVAGFRGVPLGQVLYAGDDVSGQTWDPRDGIDRRVTQETALDLAADACLRL